MNKYKVNQMSTSSPGELLVLAFEELELSIKRYLANIQPLESLSKAVHIVTTLSAILDRNSELPWINDMSDLYQFILFELISRDNTRIEKILPIVCDLRDTWNQAKSIS